MSLDALNNDLIEELQQERTMLRVHIELLHELVAAYRKPGLPHWLNQSLLALAEWLFYLLSAGVVLLMIMMRTFTFAEAFYHEKIRMRLGDHLTHAALLLYGMCLLAAICLWLCGRLLRIVRLREALARQFMNGSRSLLADHIARRSATDALEHRYHYEFPAIVYRETDREEGDDDDVNNVMNPGYGED